jgi:hypothetical protein
MARGEAVYRWQGLQTSFADPGDLFLSSVTRDEDLSLEESIKPSAAVVRDLAPLRSGRVALLWDKSFLWGYLAVTTLRDLGFSFDLLSAEAIQNKGLDSYQLLIVPGGWASLKSDELGAVGREEIRRYVSRGGGYLGLCGGAGLALQVDDGLSLLPVRRKPMAERLPNFSGTIRVCRTSTHSLWWGLQDEVSFQVWWPSEFELVEPDRIQVLGRYGIPENDFFVSDLKVCDIEDAGLDWEKLERDYQIKLDPARLLDEPAVLEGKYGKGRVLLSYPHLETPGDSAGNMALFNIWYDLLDTSVFCSSPAPDGVNLGRVIQLDAERLERAQEMALEAEQLVALGESYDLWTWRNPWLLQWRRGILGAEFGTVLVLLQGLAKELEQKGAIASASPTPIPQKMEAQFEKLGDLWRLFQKKGRALLKEESRALPESTTTNGMELSTQVRVLRTEIFNCVQCYGSKSYGGIYRQLLEQIDSLLLGALLVGGKQ